MNDENKRPTIKGIKKGIKERFSNIRNKSKVWNLRHKPTEKTAGDGEKITAMESNSYVINQDLLGENQKTVEDLIDKAKEGTVNIHEVKEEKDGDITITGEQVVEMVKQEEIKGIKAAIRNIQDFFKGLFNQKTEEQR